MIYSRERLHDYLGWDIDTWKHALTYWDKVLAHESLSNKRALELGARDGGLSLYLADKGMDVVCSDLEGPSQLAHTSFERIGLGGQVGFEQIDATCIPYEDNSFSVVIFKSMLGGVGMGYGYEGIQLAMQEMHRVLKPQGLLLFAENQAGSFFHQQARRLFVAWGKTWIYPSLDQFESLLSPFGESDIHTYGFFSCLKKDFKPFIAADRLICRTPKSKNHYMAFGYGRKGI